MATAQVERNIDRHILNLVDAIDVRTIDCGTWGFHHVPTSSTFGVTTMQPTPPGGDASACHSACRSLSKPLPTGKSWPWRGDRVSAERRAILRRYPSA